MYNDAEECVSVFVRGGGGVSSETPTLLFFRILFHQNKISKIQSAYQHKFFDIHTNSAIQWLESHVLKANFVYKICTHLKHKFGPRNQRNPGEIAS